ncbi:DUF2953 domain-containing protein [Paenibacillus koleovorans]|uniref:DUF2953 domain-containing protein n=1 Tax=Paenibacillus koleovorans TaxID=121608 RepID=UPI0013E2C58C|nr:DUF2953 domain-containing protein [Paenibacillus koleovorans]
MIWVWSGLGVALLLLLLLIWFSDVRTGIHFSRVAEDDHFNIRVRALFGLVRFEYSVPIMKFKGLKGLLIEQQSGTSLPGDLNKKTEDEEWIDKHRIRLFLDQTKQLLKYTEGLTEWTRQSMKKVRCTELRWSTRIGVVDAPETAILSGIVWGVKSAVMRVAYKYVNVQAKPVLHVFPIYNRTHFSTEFIVVTHIRAGQALLAGLRLLPRIKRVKGGFLVWRRTLFQPSNSRT